MRLQGLSAAVFATRVGTLAFVAIAGAPLGIELSAQQERPDAQVMARIRDEGASRSEVMRFASMLTDRFGPRLTGSPYTRAAGEWAAAELRRMSAKHVRLEEWGPFGRGWVNDRLVARVVAPVPFTLIAAPDAWSPSYEGPRHALVVAALLRDSVTRRRMHGHLRGKWVMMGEPSTAPPGVEPDARRLTNAYLDSLERAIPQPLDDTGTHVRRGVAIDLQPVNEIVEGFLVREGALGVIVRGNGRDGTIRAQTAKSRDRATQAPLPSFTIAPEHYGRIWRLLESGVPVTIEVELRNRFFDDNLNSFNVLAELPGTQQGDSGEVVMMGAHLDSWQSGTGATDNAAGVAVMLEAFRILAAVKAPMARTVRLALWTGEEQGLLGSLAYVKRHLGERSGCGPTLSAEGRRVTAYFNLDNGTGTIRGVYAQGNEAVRPIFRDWMFPLADLGARTVTLLGAGGTDHLSFDAVGIPAFQFIQDPIDYSTRTHHTNMDVYERLLTADLQRNAVVIASFVYAAASRAQRLPAKFDAGSAGQACDPHRDSATTPNSQRRD